MFIALRRFTLLCTVILERSMLHKQHDRATIGAVGLMIGGDLHVHKLPCVPIEACMTTPMTALLYIRLSSVCSVSNTWHAAAVAMKHSCLMSAHAST